MTAFMPSAKTFWMTHKCHTPFQIPGLWHFVLSLRNIVMFYLFLLFFWISFLLCLVKNWQPVWKPYASHPLFYTVHIPEYVHSCVKDGIVLNNQVPLQTVSS